MDRRLLIRLLAEQELAIILPLVQLLQRANYWAVPVCYWTQP